ncbi:hypothetical protein AB6A40_003140 [Gnathostoma spinigerum]|uniref:Phosphatidic acid phosphatase type 2/haloperoxidase domain-containing protein n=1 Tax=Gnathostoma spinigerum TaxID=75299 RepID=A0ABD6E9Y8_9BILA
MVSRLRPDYFAVCQPNVTANCLSGSNEYVVGAKCLNDATIDERLSFPSGHSSEAMCFFVFMLFYLQFRFKFYPTLRSFIQFVMFLFAYLCCLSRVRDNRHRYSDIFAGALLGSIIALFFVFFVSDKFSFPSSTEDLICNSCNKKHDLCTMTEECSPSNHNTAPHIA